MIYDVLIIGSGPVGIFSVFSCNLYNLKVALISCDSKLGGQLNFYAEKFLYDIPGFSKIKAKDLINNLIEQNKSVQHDVFYNELIQHISVVDSIFVVHSVNNVFQSKTVIIASGLGITMPIKIDNKFKSSKIIYNINEVENLKNKKVAILGAGNTACDYVVQLSSIAKEIVLIHRGSIKAYPYLWSSVQKVQNKTIYENFVVENISETEVAIKHKETSEQMVFNDIDFVIPCFGLQNKSNSFCNLSSTNGKIVVNPSTFETSLPGIFAIGDCCTHFNKQNLICVGFSESVSAAAAIFSHINPNSAKKIIYSSENEKFSNLFKKIIV